MSLWQPSGLVLAFGSPLHFTRISPFHTLSGAGAQSCGYRLLSVKKAFPSSFLTLAHLESFRERSSGNRHSLSAVFIETLSAALCV